MSNRSIMKIKLSHRFEDLIHIENLLLAWEEFLKGKKKKKDVQEFQFNLMDNILSLHYDLSNGKYRHGGYQEFNISDPKPRIIHKATVRDRLLHRAVYRILYPFFDDTFIADSFSCRNDKGTHKAMKRFLAFSRIVSKNNTRTCWVLKCDIKKFFASIDQTTLIKILDERIADKRIISLLKEIISSFKSHSSISLANQTAVGFARPAIGLPLGNLTSQLFSNVYMNEFDQFVKQRLKIKYYIRYADDFVIFSQDKQYLEKLIPLIKEFLQNNLKLTLHPDKIYMKTLSSGVDFLGWTHFFDHRVLRTVTKRRMFKRLAISQKPETLNSYMGLLKHGNSYAIREKLIDQADF